MRKILVIEDDRIMRENMAEILELSGYHVEVAENGKEGLLKARALQPDLIVCDIKMPALDGYGVLHLLNKEPELAAVPFIFITAKTERSDRRKGMEMGADDYITKPFEDTELLRAVEVRLKKKEDTAHKSQTQEGSSDIGLGKMTLIDQLKKLTKTAKVNYKSHDIIFRAGDFPHVLFFVEKGKVKSYTRNSEGKELISNIYGQGDFFGYQAILENREYQKTAEALEATRLQKIPKEALRSLMNKNGRVAGEFIKMLSEKLSHKEQELVRMAYDSVRKRLAIKLLQLAPASAQSEISISRTDLASMVGTSTETLVRTLSEFKEMEIIADDSHKIILLDKDKLRDMAKAW